VAETEPQPQSARSIFDDIEDGDAADAEDGHDQESAED
jgi:hypothetical protein